MARVRLRHSRPINQDINSMQFNIYSEFPEFSRKQLDRYIELFHTYDLDGTGKMTVEGLKKMMEKLGLTQTHLRTLLLTATTMHSLFTGDVSRGEGTD